MNLVRKTQDKFHELQLKMEETDKSQADRIDKNLLKNLIIGYIVAPANDKPQILKLVSSVLDFNQTESDKVGLNKQHTGWLDSILHGTKSPGADKHSNGMFVNNSLKLFKTTINSVL